MTRILIIDDEPQIRRFLTISLESQGYQLSEADTGRRGLEQIALEQPDLIILDLGLPDIDGQQVKRRSLCYRCATASGKKWKRWIMAVTTMWKNPLV